jgi:hypothetical protein
MNEERMTINKIEKVKTELNYIIEYLEKWNMDHLQTKTLKDAITIIDELEQENERQKEWIKKKNIHINHVNTLNL